jgi:hypothetical protein
LEKVEVVDLFLESGRIVSGYFVKNYGQFELCLDDIYDVFEQPLGKLMQQSLLELTDRTFLQIDKEREPGLTQQMKQQEPMKKSKSFYLKHK